MHVNWLNGSNENIMVSRVSNFFVIKVHESTYIKKHDLKLKTMISSTLLNTLG